MYNFCTFTLVMKDMKTITEMGMVVKVRLFSYKSFRHYGGREITGTPYICAATVVGIQEGHQKYIVELLEPCAGYPTGHKIAVSEKNYNI